MHPRRRWLSALAAPVLSLGVLAGASASEAPPGRRVLWQERFARTPLAWVDPFDHDRETLARVYSVRTEDGTSFLHARYDGTVKNRPPAMHYGQPFQKKPSPLERVKSLDWRWRVTQHPSVTKDPWVDCAAGIYGIIKQPTMLSGGRGYKFAWLAKPGPTGTRQHGLLRFRCGTTRRAGLEERERRSCALYRRDFGRARASTCSTWASRMSDGTKTVAEADYADFELIAPCDVVRSDPVPRPVREP